MTDTENAPPVKVDAPADSKAETSTDAKPIFGSTFGTTGGFSAFAGSKAVSTGADGETAAGAEVEEECRAEFTPLVQLDEVETNTGEENEECLLELKCKLYRYDQGSKEWKERGIGQAKFLKHKESKKTRFLMRQDKTLKIRANHIVMPGTNITCHAGNDRAWVWTAMDFADEEQKLETFAIRFGTVEKASEFKKQYEASMEDNKPLLSGSAAAGEPAAGSKKKVSTARTDSAADEAAKETDEASTVAPDEAESKAVDDLAGKIAGVAVSEKPKKAE